MFIDYKLLGRRIAKHRKDNHITQERLAEQMNVSTAYISKIERGSAQLSLERLVQICQLLCASPSVLLYGSDPEDSSYMLPELGALIRQCPKETLPLIKALIEDVPAYQKTLN